MIHATANITEQPIRVYHGKAIFMLKRGQPAGKFACTNGLIAIITAKEQSIPVMTGRPAPFFQKTASNNPPSSAPLVSPRSLKAASTTKVTSRLLITATPINAAPQKRVEILLKRRKKVSDRFFETKPFTKSIVETERSEERRV